MAFLQQLAPFRCFVAFQMNWQWCAIEFRQQLADVACIKCLLLPLVVVNKSSEQQVLNDLDVAFFS